MVVGLLAQATAPEDPDLTVPIVAIVACAVVVVVTLVLQRLHHRRTARTATAEELDAWQLDGGRLLDQWIAEVEAEVHARRTSPTPEAVSRSDDPLGLDRAIRECPDARLATVIADLRAAGAGLLTAVREGDPHGPPAIAAQARFDAAKGQAGTFLATLRAAPAPQ
jgi:hypothetical protein